MSEVAGVEEGVPDSAKSLNIVLIGSGGVGTIAALTLSKSGRARVTTVLRSKYDIVTEKGWDIDSIDHGVINGWKSDRVVKSIEDAVYVDSDSNGDGKRKEMYDYIVLCTKQLPNITPTSPMLAPLITPNHTTIVLIQNGIFIETPLIAAFPGTPILSAVSMIGSFTVPPNRISHLGPDILQIGAHYHSSVSDRVTEAKLDEFVGLYRAGGAADCTIATNMAHARWAKLLWNASFNTLCALLLLDVGQIQRSDRAKGLVMGIMKEIQAVAAKDNVNLDQDLVEHMATRSPENSTWRPSMLLDREAGRPMEVEVILGNVVRRGAELGVECPVAEGVYELLKIVDGAIQEPATLRAGNGISIGGR